MKNLKNKIKIKKINNFRLIKWILNFLNKIKMNIILLIHDIKFNLF